MNSLLTFIKDKNSDIALLILRISLSGLMLLHGIGKLLHGVGGIEQMLQGMGLPSFFAYGVIVGEVVAPLLILVGWRTRIASLIFAFNMLVAVLMAHASQIFTLSPQGGWAIELPALYFLVSLALCFTGAGKYALSSHSVWD